MNRTLLLVEDNPGDADLIEDLLVEVREHSSRIVRAPTLTQALTQLRLIEVDAVLLDLRLPDGSGVECVNAVRDRAVDIPIIVLTGMDDHELALSCIAAGAQDYLCKQELRTENLRRAIGYAMARSREQSERRRADTLEQKLNIELLRQNYELKERDAQMRALTTRLNAVREQERTRISRTVHDELGQLLTGLKMELCWIGKRFAPGQTIDTPEVVARLLDAERMADSTIETVQQIAIELRPSALDSLGLHAAICDEARRFGQRLGIATDVQVGRWTEPTTETATALFRIFQELLTNIARHAHAVSVHVVLGEDARDWTLHVEDDGVGLRDIRERRPTSLGILGMKERAEALGGSVALAGGVERGTIATVRIPKEAVVEHA
jgi:signal transduction histidine kinase